MPTPITLRNIGIPDFSGANNLFVQGGQQITGAISSLANRATQEQANLRAADLDSLIASYTDSDKLADFDSLAELQKAFRVEARSKDFTPSEFNAANSQLTDAFNAASALTPEEQSRLSQQEALLQQQVQINQGAYDAQVQQLAGSLGLDSALLRNDIPLAEAANNASKLVDDPSAILSLQRLIQEVGQEVTGRPYAVTGNLLQHFVGTGIEEGFIFDDSLDGGAVGSDVRDNIRQTIAALNSVDASKINGLKRNRALLDLQASQTIEDQLRDARAALQSNRRNAYVGRDTVQPVPTNFDTINSIYAPARSQIAPTPQPVATQKPTASIGRSSANIFQNQITNASERAVTAAQLEEERKDAFTQAYQNYFNRQ